MSEDNNIIKALECCILGDCQGCFYGDTDQRHCKDDLMQNALELINRQKAEIERLEFVRTREAQRYEQKRSDQAHTNCVLIDLHSQAIKEVKVLEDKLKTANAEIEELTQKYEWKHREYMNYRKKHSLLKAEVIKEFAEKSKKSVFIKQEDERKQMLKILKTYRGTRTYSDTEQATDNWLRGYGEAVQNILDIHESIIKEMVGGNDEMSV